MQTMEAAAKDLALRKKITRETAMQLVNNPKLFDDVPTGGGPPGAPPRRV